MSSLQRYKKSGGFFQLLSLIETFGPDKKKKFLEMIESESPMWAKALRGKMLSLERIFGWNEEVVIDIFKRLPVKQQAYALQGLKDEYKAKIVKFISASEQRRFSDILSEGNPKPEEFQAAVLKIVETTRQLLKDREIQAERFDAELVIPEDYEAKLEDAGANAAALAMVPHAPEVTVDAPTVAASGQPAAPGQAADVYQLQRSLGLVLKENKQLKEEVRTLRDKLEQIRKIA
jgi:hypothetical protein